MNEVLYVNIGEKTIGFSKNKILFNIAALNPPIWVES